MRCFLGSALACDALEPIDTALDVRFRGCDASAADDMRDMPAQDPLRCSGFKATIRSWWSWRPTTACSWPVHDPADTALNVLTDAGAGAGARTSAGVTDADSMIGSESLAGAADAAFTSVSPPCSLCAFFAGESKSSSRPRFRSTAALLLLALLGRLRSVRSAVEGVNLP